MSAPQHEADPLDASAQLWEDISGGELLLAITHPDYTSQHRVRVRPFDGSGAFVGAPGGTTANLSQEAQNLIDLLTPLYGTGTAAQFFAVQQVKTDNTGTVPFSYAFTGTVSFGAGTGAGPRWPTWVVASFVAVDSFGGRWKLELPGSDQVAIATISRGLYSSQTTVVKAFMDYLQGNTNGPIVAAKTNVVSHAGNPLRGVMSVVTNGNKRLRRHFKVS